MTLQRSGRIIRKSLALHQDLSDLEFASTTGVRFSTVS